MTMIMNKNIKIKEKTLKLKLMIKSIKGEIKKNIKSFLKTHFAI